MELHAKLVRSQLSFFKPFVAGLSLEVTRKGQDKLGELMTALHRREVLVRDHDFGAFQGAWVMPKDQRRSGVILYLHGGGYTCGSLEYAKGFAATLASECGVRVFCPAYRLAPEHPYPAALDDARESYQYLLKKGYEPRQILLAGESAGGGLIYSLCLRLKRLGMALPCGCPGSQSRQIKRAEDPHAGAQCAVQESRLSQWPVQIKLVPVNAPYFDGAKLLIAADCTAYAYAAFHERFMRGHITLVGCPKLDSVDYAEKLTEIISENDVKSVTVVRMEVPCCGGLERAAVTALKNSGKFIPWQVVTVTLDGRLKEE